MVPLVYNLKKDTDYNLLPIPFEKNATKEIFENENYVIPPKINLNTISIICDDLIELLRVNYELFIVNFFSGKFLDQSVQNFAFNICYLLKKCLRNITIYPFGKDIKKIIIDYIDYYESSLISVIQENIKIYSSIEFITKTVEIKDYIDDVFKNNLTIQIDEEIDKFKLKIEDLYEMEQDETPLEILEYDNNQINKEALRQIELNKINKTQY
jgi:hypothetical protein